MIELTNERKDEKWKDEKWKDEKWKDEYKDKLMRMKVWMMDDSKNEWTFEWMNVWMNLPSIMILLTSWNYCINRLKHFQLFTSIPALYTGVGVPGVRYTFIS